MIIDGRAIAQKIEQRIQSIVHKLHVRKPALAFIRVGEHPASHSYIRMKKKKCAEVGIHSIDREFPEKISQDKLLEEIEALNQNPLVDGILIQLPLPTQIQTHVVLSAIDPTKDVE